MTVYVAQILLQHNALCRQFAMVVGVERSVEWDILIGHDAATAVDCAMLAQSLVLQRVGKVYAVGIGKFAALQAVDYIHSIVAILTLLVWLLYATTRWGVVVGNGQSDHRTIWHVEWALNQSLAKRAATYYYTAVLGLVWRQ